MSLISAIQERRLPSLPGSLHYYIVRVIVSYAIICGKDLRPEHQDIIFGLF